MAIVKHNGKYYNATRNANGGWDLGDEVAAPQEPPKPKSIAVQTADALRPGPQDPNDYSGFMSPETRFALGNTAADLAGGFVGMGENIKNIPAGLLNVGKRVLSGDGGEVMSELWDVAKKNPLTTGVSLIPGAGVIPGMLSQVGDQKIRGDKQHPADQFSDVLTAGFGQELPGMARRLRPATQAAPLLTKATQTRQPVTVPAVARSVMSAQGQQIRAPQIPRLLGGGGGQPPKGPVSTGTPPAVPGDSGGVGISIDPRKTFEQASGLPGSELGAEIKSQLSNPLTPKNMVKHGLSRASGVPIDAIEEVVRNPQVMKRYMALGDDAWQRFTEGQQAKIRELPEVESKVFNTIIENSDLKPDQIVNVIEDAPTPSSIMGPDGRPVMTTTKQTVQKRIPGTPIDTAPVVQSFDGELRRLGVLDANGNPTMGNPETSGLLKVSEAEAVSLLEMRDKIIAANSADTVKGTISQIDGATSYSGKQVKPIGTIAEKALSQARRALAQSLEAADTSGAVKAANNRYAKFRKFYDEMEAELGGKGAVSKFRNAQKGEKTLLKENLERLHGKRPLADLDPRYPTPAVSLWDTGDDALREIDLMTKGDYFNPFRPEPITSTGRDMMGLGATALTTALTDPVTGLATGLFWYNTRPAQLGQTLLKFGEKRNRYRLGQ
jgi:hypothetical protein